MDTVFKPSVNVERLDSFPGEMESGTIDIYKSLMECIYMDAANSDTYNYNSLADCGSFETEKQNDTIIEDESQPIEKDVSPVCSDIRLSVLTKQALVDNRQISRGSISSNHCEETNDIVLNASEQQQVPRSIVVKEIAKENGFSCTQCDIMFDIRITWERHMRLHKIQDGPYICHVCGTQLSRKDHLWRHMKNIHKLEGSVKCNVCGENVSRKSLKTHTCMLKHNVSSGPAIQMATETSGIFNTNECHLCGMQFATISNQKRHLKRMVCVRNKQPQGLESDTSNFIKVLSNVNYQQTQNHVTPFTRRCELCDIVIKDENSFLEHEEQHRGPGTVKCEICGEGCIPGRHLQHHTMLHVSDTPYKCEVCSQCFSLPSQLDRHLLTHSTANVLHSENTKSDHVILYGSTDKQAQTNSTAMVVLCEDVTGNSTQELTEYTNQQVVRSAIHVDDDEKTLQQHLTKSLVHAEDTNGELFQDMVEHQQSLKSAVIVEKSEANNHECTKFNSRFNHKRTWERHVRRHKIQDGLHICHVCSKQFSNKKNLWTHVKNSHKLNLSVKCKICGVHVTEKYFQTHMLRHNSNEPLIHMAANTRGASHTYKCHLCGVQFSTMSNRRRHLMRKVCVRQQKKEQTLNVTYQQNNNPMKAFTRRCELCDIVMKDENSFLEHEEQHRRLGTVKCEICGEGCIPGRHLQHHTMLHVSDTPYKCEVCSQRFSLPSQLDSHLLTHSTAQVLHSESTKCDLVMLDGSTDQQASRPVIIAEQVEADNLECTKCNKRFNIKLSWERHMRRHNIKDGLHVCHVCGEQLSSRKNLLKHLQVIHKTPTSVKCELCGVKVFYNHLESHMLQHASSKPYGCEVCGRHFVDASKLDKHMPAHFDIRPYNCNICSKSFKRVDYLDNHIRCVHEKPRHCKHECHICQKKFLKKWHLNTHMRYHTNKNTYKCDICLKGFSIKAKLAIHSLVHTGVRAYKCDVCGKSFQMKHHLVTHMKSHSTDRPFTCDICSCSFVLKHHLAAHINTHKN